MGHSALSVAGIPGAHPPRLMSQGKIDVRPPRRASSGAVAQARLRASKDRY